MADKGIFTPKNPQKYIGKNLNKITFRSTWELTMMLRFDQDPQVLNWMSESLPSRHVHKGLDGIPYLNPLTGKWTLYVPDFFVIYIDKKNKQHMEVIEVKPLDEVPVALSGYTGTVSKLKEAKQILNAAKFAAAMMYCAKNGFFFRYMSEKQIFGLQ